MSEWSKKATEIIDKHVKRKKSVEAILNKLLSELEYRKDFEIVNTDKLEWKIQIALKTFILTNEEIILRQKITKQNEYGEFFPTGEIRDLEEVIQELILEKIS